MVCTLWASLPSWSLTLFGSTKGALRRLVPAPLFPHKLKRSAAEAGKYFTNHITLRCVLWSDLLTAASASASPLYVQKCHARLFQQPKMMHVFRGENSIPLQMLLTRRMYFGLLACARRIHTPTHITQGVKERCLSAAVIKIEITNLTRCKLESGGGAHRITQ